jgi:hypothetical protein
VPDMPTGALVRLYHIQRRMSTVSLATGLLSVYKRAIYSHSQRHRSMVRSTVRDPSETYCRSLRLGDHVLSGNARLEKQWQHGRPRPHPDRSLPR